MSTHKEVQQRMTQLFICKDMKVLLFNVQYLKENTSEHFCKVMRIENRCTEEEVRAGRLVLPTFHFEQVGVNVVAHVMGIERLPVLLDLLHDEVVNDLHVHLIDLQAKNVTRKLLQHPIKSSKENSKELRYN